MPRRVWRSLDGPYVAPRPGDTVDLRGTTRAELAEERKEILLSSYYAGIGSYFGGYSSVTTVPGRPWSLERGVKEGYGRVPWVHAAVRVIAISQSRLRFGVKDGYKEVGEGATEIEGDPLIPKLNVRSNPVEYAYQLRQRVSTQWMLSPRGGFIETVPPAASPNSKRVTELRLLPAGRTRIVPDDDGNIDHFEVDPVGGVGKPRPIPPERVRWFREPHPTDPFAGLTPLEAAGLSVEMDYFARLFNRQFMANDGRPGGIVGVSSPDGKGEPADETELDRVERKFGGGPIDAGRLVVLDGTVTYNDVTKSARDMQWKDAGIAARNEIFGVFLVPVSAVDASGRTFSNAGQEWINFWVLMGQPHGDAFAWLFHDDVDGVPFLDYSKVEALQEVKRQNRAELRDEVDQGLRTRLSYAQQTGQTVGDSPGDFPDQPGTRALWIPAGLVPVAATEDDQVAAEKLAPVGTGTQAAPMSAGAVDGGGGFDGGDPAGGGDGGDGGGGGFDGGDPFAGDGTKARTASGRPRGHNVARLSQQRARRERRLRAVGMHDDEDKEDDRGRPVEAALTAALTQLAQRQVGVALARARGTKARMGTRHWAPKPGEPWSTKQLDPSDVVDPTQWSDQAAQAAQANLGPLAAAQAQVTAQQAVDDDPDVLAALAVAAGVAVPTVAAVAPPLAAGAVAAIVAWVATSAANAGAELLEAIGDAERADAARVAAGGQSAGIQPVVDAINAWAQKIPAWVQRVAPTSTAQAIEAGKHAVLSPLGDRVEREWRTKLDDRVREAHRAAEGQVAKGSAAFVVGGEPLRYPRDPLGSPGNVINCFPAGTWVDAVEVTGATRRWYEGEMVTLRTASDRLVAATPNHPLLTDRGWVAAGALDVGDNLVCASAGRLWRDAPVEPDVEHVPPCIYEVYDALALAQDAVRVGGRPVDFHGDGTEREVHVVRPDGELPVGDEPAFCQECGERVLTVADVVARSLPTDGAAVEFVGAGHAAAAGGVGGARESAALVGRQARHTGTERAAAVTQLDAGSGQPLAERLAGYAPPSGEDLHALAGEVALDEVVEVVRDSEWRGHVYNLECDPDIFLANGVVAHNCRCRTRWRLASKQQTKGLAVGQNVVADVLAMPTPSVARRGGPEKADMALLERGSVGGGGADWRAGRVGGIDRVEPTHALAGVTGRDHVGEILGFKDIVRTVAGEHAFHEPIGSPIGHGGHGGDWQATRILKVHDSRDLVEQGDRFVRVPGTGQTRKCDRCGKDHEVHVTVEDQHGAQHTVGTACARATGPAASKLKSVTSATATADKLEAQAAKAEQYQAQRRAALEQVRSTMQMPPHTEMPSKLGSGTDFVLPDGEGYQRVAHAEGHAPTDKEREYAVGQIRGQWEQRRVDEIVPRVRGLDHADVAEMKRKAAKARKKANDLLDAPTTPPAAKGDPVAGLLSAKVRRVRTEGGVRRYHEPEGSPIVAHPHDPLAGLGGHDHAGAVAADAARTPTPVPDSRQALANLLSNRTIEGGALHPSPAGHAPIPAPTHTGRMDVPGRAAPTSTADAMGRVHDRLRDHAQDNASVYSTRPAYDSAAHALLQVRNGMEQGNPPKGVRAAWEHAQPHLDALHDALGGDKMTPDPGVRAQRQQELARMRHDAQALVDHYASPVADALPDTGATGDMARAKAELEAKGQTVLGLIDKGMEPAKAEKEYARLLHNARFRYRRERLKAEKAAGGKVEKAVADDVAQGPKEVTLAGIGQQLLDTPEDVKLDLALGKEQGVQPKALYSVAGGTVPGETWKVGVTGAAASVVHGPDESPGPGAVRGNEKWYDKLTADTADPIPVRDLHIESGYVVKHGAALRKNGVSYLVETAGPEPTAAELARLHNASTVYEAMLGGVPGDRRGLQRGVTMVNGDNPRDGYWAQQYGIPGFKSAATGGRGGTTWWGTTVNPSTAAHEFGHNLDSGAYLPGTYVSDADGPVVPGQAQSWKAAGFDDRATRLAFAPGGELYGKFHETRQGTHPILAGHDTPTDYASKSVHEDFAESVRLYLKDRREGKVGYLDPQPGQALGTNVRFADLWPARARQLDAVFGVQSDYETPFVKQQQAKAVAALIANRTEIHEALQTQGAVPENIGLEDGMRRFGLGTHAYAQAWTEADAAFQHHLDSKNKADALEHVKDQWGGAGEVPDAGAKAEMVATLEDGFGLAHQDAVAIVGDAVVWKQGQLDAAAEAQKAGEAKLAAEAAVQDVLSLADLPKELQTVIRKRRATVKLRAKQKGATAEQAEAIAAQYEAEQIAKEAKKLGLEGQVGLSVSKVAKDVGAKAKGPKAAKPKAGDASDGELRVTAKWGSGSKGAKSFLTKAGAAVAPGAQHAGYWGKPQQAKANIAASLAASLNNEQDWQAFRAYRNSGAHVGHGAAFMPPPVSQQINAFEDYTAEQRQTILDAEVEQRIAMWASTSGDSNPFAIMMQQAVKDELGVPGPVGVNDSQGKDSGVTARYPHVQAFYRRFVRVQYDDTQRQLEADGIEWLPLYRGMRVTKGTHPWANESDGAHVPLQPASSFSTAPNVSARFSGHGQARMMIRGMVHRSMILGSARTGFGCLNEKEYVVLAPNEDEARFQVRYGAYANKAAEWDAAFAKAAVTAPGLPWDGTGHENKPLSAWPVMWLEHYWKQSQGHKLAREMLAAEFSNRGLPLPPG